MDTKINMESLLLSHYIKYDKLFELCNISLANIKSNTIDIYIDLYDILKKIYTTDIKINKRFIIVSSIINLAAHYRGYFWSRHRLYTRIFLVYGDNISNNQKQFIPTFGNDQFRNTKDYDKNNIFINSQLELVKILVGYIDNVYYIRRRSHFSAFVYHNILANNSINPSIIISKDKYNYQLPALNDNILIFRPKKYNGQDISYYINKGNVYDCFYNKSSKDTIENLHKLNPELLSLLISLNGLPKYKLFSVMNISTAVKLVLDAIIKNKIINGYNSDIKYVASNLNGLTDYIDMISLEYRFNTVDLIVQSKIYDSTIEANDMQWYINLKDPKTVKDINNKYFADNPLDLNNL